MFTPSKSSDANFIDVTLLSTPQPKASSTVQRKSTLGSKFYNEDIHETMYKQPMISKGDITHKSDDSSLGILDNISSFLAEVSETGDLNNQNENKLDTERELARKLLQSCSNIKPTSITHDTNKENNVNIQNMSSNVTPSALVDQGQFMSYNQTSIPNESTLPSVVNKTSSIVFEPNEISARSSGLSRSSEKRLSALSNKNVNAITFDSTTAELMAQFNNEEFRPASEMASQMLADEASWQQNYSYALPTTANPEKEYLNLSCFSGIIGELDLSVESCAGRKMSVDEFFKRKCGNFGELADGAVERPSLGLSVNSPKKTSHLIPLVDSTFVVLNKQSKPMNVINNGNMPVWVSASFVDMDSRKSSKYFSVQPENLLLQPNKAGCFNVAYKSQNTDASKMVTKIQFKVANNVYEYSVYGESSNYQETQNEPYLRCETPQILSSVSSPSSPHSVISNKSGTSGRNSPLSSVSGSTVAGEKIPIRTTHAALVWNSIKAGKSDVKEFTIRNISNNKIKLQAIISDNEKNFRFLRDRHVGGTSIVLVLQGSESRTLSVAFNPHHLGAATGKIIFRHYEPRRDDSESRPSKLLFLYGYGGYSRVEIFEAYKDTSGKMWLSLGTLNSGGSLSAKLRLQNTGDLCSYVKIKLIPKAVYPSMVSSWRVNPTELILNPKETQWVTLEFHPRKEDLALLRRSDVSHVGTILITHGDEPSRWRIRRLYNKMKETGELSGSENEAFKNIVQPICKVFPGEQLMSDINTIRDSVQNLGDLCRGIWQHEVMLTMEVCADETLSVLHDNADESQMFYSLCSDNSHIYDGNGESFLPSDTLLANSTFQHAINVGHFIVTPNTVILTPPTKMEAIVTIKTTCTVAQVFDTALSNTEYLSVMPAEGMIPTRRDFQLKIQCKRKIDRSFNAVLEIYTENNKLDVQIKVNVKRM